jgi:hypothetical protein
MNPDLTLDGKVVLSKGTLHLLRSKLLWQGCCYEHIRPHAPWRGKPRRSGWS